MSYAIVYSSVTGNTALLAQAIRETLPWETCCYFGAPDPQALSAERIYVGFWTDRGTCDAATAQFLRQLTRQEVFLFGTAGFGGDSAYFQRILERAEENLGPEVRVVGTYLLVDALGLDAVALATGLGWVLIVLFHSSIFYLGWKGIWPKRLDLPLS